MLYSIYQQNLLTLILVLPNLDFAPSPTNIPVKGPTLIEIASNWSDLFNDDGSGNLIKTSLQDAQALNGGDLFYWSGSTSTGDFDATYNCNNFKYSKESNYEEEGSIGLSRNKDVTWLAKSPVSGKPHNKCYVEKRVLCAAW